MPPPGRCNVDPCRIRADKTRPPQAQGKNSPANPCGAEPHFQCVPSPARIRPELPPTAGLPLEFGDYLQKPALTFTDGLSSWPGLPGAIVACSGTAALVVALQTLRCRCPERNTIIVPAYTCPLVPLAIRLTPGLRVVVCDTRPGEINLDPQCLENLCDKRTLAVLPTHLGGRVADVATAAALAASCGAAVIEDAAQALGAFAEDGRSVGLHGDIGFFSLAAGKGLSIFEGGILVSKDAYLRAELAVEAQNTLRPSLLWTFRRNLELAGYGLLYHPTGLRLVYGHGLRKKLAAGDEVGALGDYFTLADIPLHSVDSLRLRVAANGLRRLPDYLAQGKKRAEERRRRLENLPGVQVLGDKKGANGVWPFFMLVLPSQQQRDRALQKLWRAGMGVSKLFACALPDYNFLSWLHEEEGAGHCPNARDLANRMLTLSNTPWLHEAAFDSILNELEMSL